MRRVALGALLGTALWASPAAAGDYEALRAAVGVRSGFSGGSQSVGELAQAARARGLDALVLTDDYRASIEHGWPGLRRLTSRRTNAPSLPDGVAVQEYLEAVRRVQDSQPDLVLLEGVRATPFYRWEIDWKRARWTPTGSCGGSWIRAAC